MRGVTRVSKNEKFTVWRELRKFIQTGKYDLEFGSEH